MFIQIAALLSIFQLIFTVDSTNLLLTGSEISEKNISDDVTVKDVQEQIELLQAINDNVRAEMSSLGVIFTQHLTKQKKELKEDLEELKAALFSTKKLSDSEKTKGPTNTIYRSRKLRNENSETNQSTCHTLPTSCTEAIGESGSNGVYKIKIPNSRNKPIHVYCIRDFDANDSENKDAWMIIQRRQDGSIDFLQDWVDYQNGFGNLEREYFIGLDTINDITDSSLHELWVQLEDFEGETRWAKYSTFGIGGEIDNYALNILGDYSGDAGDSLTYHQGYKWTTFDKDNDVDKRRNCATASAGAWWYSDCQRSNLNGPYVRGNLTKNQIQKGIIWEAWRGPLYSLKYVHMAIRPTTELPYCDEITEE